jgi:hypothetical protein
MSNEVAFVNPQFVREPYELPEMTRSEQDDSFSFKDLEDDYEKIREQIRSLATKKLFHWTDVPVEFPKPLVDPENGKLTIFHTKNSKYLQLKMKIRSFRRLVSTPRIQ